MPATWSGSGRSRSTGSICAPLPRAAWQALAAWDKPFLVAFSDRDPITGAMAPILRRAVPGAAGIEHPVITGAGHFLQEDAGEQLGGVIADFVRSHPIHG